MAFKQERWAEVVANLEKVQQLAPSSECITLLAQARSALQEQMHASFNEFRSEAEVALRERQWSEAAAKYEAAHGFGEDSESRKASAFAKCMAEAETMFASQPSDAFGVFKLTRKYEQAFEEGIDQDYVRQRIQAVKPASYRITFNDAVILPFKPTSKTPWDGPPNPVAGADALLSGLGEMFEVSQPLVVLMPAILKLASAGQSDPDCYLSVSIGDKTFVNRDGRAKNSLHPTWQFAITFPPTNVFDTRMLHIRVIDADVTQDDDVGTHQISLGELVQRTGAHTYTLCDEKGKLASGGLLTLTVTVERQ